MIMFGLREAGNQTPPSERTSARVSSARERGRCPLLTLCVKYTVGLQLAGAARRVAVVGIKTADKASQPAYFVPQYLQQQGVKIYPVPVCTPLQSQHVLLSVCCMLLTRAASLP